MKTKFKIWDKVEVHGDPGEIVDIEESFHNNYPVVVKLWSENLKSYEYCRFTLDGKLHPWENTPVLKLREEKEK